MPTAQKKMLDLSEAHKDLEFFSVVSPSRLSRPLLDTYQVLGEAYSFAGLNETAYRVLSINTSNFATGILASNLGVGWLKLITSLLQLFRVCVRLNRIRDAGWCFFTAFKLALRYGYLKDIVDYELLERQSKRRRGEFQFLSSTLNAEKFEVDVIRFPPITVNEDVLINYWEPNIQKREIISVSQDFLRHFLDRGINKKSDSTTPPLPKPTKEQNGGLALRTNVISSCPLCGKELATMSDMQTIVKAGKPRMFDSNDSRLNRIHHKAATVFRKNGASAISKYFPSDPIIIAELDYHFVIYPICQDCKFRAGVTSDKEMGEIMVRIRKESLIRKG